MSVSGHHVIRKLSLQVELNGTEAHGLALHSMLPGLCEHRLTPVIERILERYAEPGVHLSIGRLEIDAGDLSFDRLEQGLAEAVSAALEKTLGRHVSDSAKPGAALPDNISYKTTQHSLTEAFVFFLRTGSLPWSFHLPGGVTLEQAMLEAWEKPAAAGRAEVIAGPMLRAIVHPSARMRLARQFTSRLLGVLVPVLSPRAADILHEASAMVHVKKSAYINPKTAERQIVESVLADIAGGNLRTPAEYVNEALPGSEAGMLRGKTGTVTTHGISSELDENPARAEGRSNETGQVIKKEMQQTGIAESIIRHAVYMLRSYRLQAGVVEKVEKRIREMVIENLETGKKTTAQEILTGALDFFNASGFADAAGPGPETGGTGLNNFENGTDFRNHKTVLDRGMDSAENSGPVENYFKTETDFVDINEGIYIRNAGLVIFHYSFFVNLFSALGIATYENILQPERALCLMHYLVTGHSTAHEYELVLPKILCNIPPEAPVDTDVELSAAEMEEGTAMLEAVIGHWAEYDRWGILKEATPDRLRGSYLYRPGKITSLDNGDWFLQVELNPWDVCLDDLPWGISVVKTPWMNRNLHVQWPYASLGFK